MLASSLLLSCPFLCPLLSQFKKIKIGPLLCPSYHVSQQHVMPFMVWENIKHTIFFTIMRPTSFIYFFVLLVSSDIISSAVNILWCSLLSKKETNPIQLGSFHGVFNAPFWHPQLLFVSICSHSCWHSCFCCCSLVIS